MDGFVSGPWWELLLVLFGAVLGLVLQVLAFGRPSGPPPSQPLRLDDLKPVRPPPENVTRVVVEHRKRRDASDDDDEMLLWVIGVVAVAFALAAAYLEARQEIAAGLRALILTGLGFWLVTYGFLLRRKVIVGLGWILTTAGSGIVFLLAPAMIAALEDPGYVVGRDYGELLAAYDECGIGGLGSFDGLRGASFVVTQLTGVALYVTAWAAAASLLLVCLAMAAKLTGARPRRLWLLLARIPGPWRTRPGWIIVWALVCAVLALTFAGGAAQRTYAKASSLDGTPELSSVTARQVRGSIDVVVWSDYPARATITLRRSGRTLRTIRRHAEQGENHWRFGQADGRPWPREVYRLWLTARDASGETSKRIEMFVPGRHPAGGCDEP